MLNPSIGHNLPPTDAEILADKLNENCARELSDMAAILETAIPDAVNDEIENKKLEQFIDRVKHLKKTFDATHKREKAPYLEMGRVVDQFFKRRIEDLDAFIAKANAPRTVFLNRKAEEERKLAIERARKATEESDRLAAEAAAHEAVGITDTAQELMGHAIQSENKAVSLVTYAAEAKNSKLVRGLVTKWVGEIESIGAVDLDKLRLFFTEEQMQTAINKFVRDGGRELAGVRIYQKSEAR